MRIFNNILGERYGRLVVIKQAGKDKHGGYLWLCKCDCGNEKVILANSLLSGKTQSCGCLAREQFGNRTRKHGKSRTRLYKIWLNITMRCENTKLNYYKNYGGRGITVCDEWRNNYQAFCDWAMTNGYNENAKTGECTIDRIDVDGNYCPENCRWITRAEQANNKRNNHFLELNGERHTVKEWSEITGINSGSILSRIKYGWTTQRVLQEPIKHAKSKSE